MAGWPPFASTTVVGAILCVILALLGYFIFSVCTSAHARKETLTGLVIVTGIVAVVFFAYGVGALFVYIVTRIIQ